MNVIFISYINRSGSTFLLQQLSKSDNILSCPEADCLANIFLTNPYNLIQKTNFHKILNSLYSDFKFKNWSIPIESISKINCNRSGLQIFLEILLIYKELTKPSATVIVYKAERLFQLIPFFNDTIIYKYNLKFITLIRDIRAVYYSQKNTTIPESGKIMSSVPVDLAFRWNSFIYEMTSIKKEFHLIISYENLIRECSETLNKIDFWLNSHKNLSFQNNGDLFERLPRIHKNIHKDIVDVPLIKKISSWKDNLTNKEIAIIEIISRKHLRNLNYELVTPRVFLPYIYLHIFLRRNITILKKTAKIIFFKLHMILE